MENSPSVNSQDTDPWTFFGSFSLPEIEGATKLLRDNGLVFEIKEGAKQESYPEGGWTGPFALWVRDEHIELANSLLVPHFAKAK